MTDTSGIVNVLSLGDFTLTNNGFLNVFSKTNQSTTLITNQLLYNNNGTLESTTDVTTDGNDLILNIPINIGNTSDFQLSDNSITSTGALTFSADQVTFSSTLTVPNIFTVTPDNINIDNDLVVFGELESTETGYQRFFISDDSTTGDLLITANGVFTDLFTPISYTPRLSNSNIRISIDCNYIVQDTSSQCLAAALLSVDGQGFSTTEQIIVSNTGGGTRSGTLLPISITYPNTNTTTKSIQLQIEKSGSNILFQRTQSLFVMIWEIQN